MTSRLLGDTGAACELELAEGRDIGAEPFLAEQPQHGDRWECLRAVDDQRIGSRGAIGPRLCAQSRLVVDDERRAEAPRELCRSDPAEDELGAGEGGAVGEELVEGGVDSWLGHGSMVTLGAP